MFINILVYKIFCGTKVDLLKQINEATKINIISGNPEVLYMGMYNEKLKSLYLNSKSIIIPDGVGTVIASKILNTPVKEKIAGIEVMEEIIKNCEAEGKGIYLVGAQEEILKECIINLIIKYPKLKILGSKNGYFDLDNCKELIEDIEEKQPFALFVAMGCPRQEIFISKYFETLPCKVFMGVGGSFDVFAGKVKRAPKWMINLGLEWLYRVANEPFRIKRLIYIPRFLMRVLISKYFKKRN